MRGSLSKVSNIRLSQESVNFAANMHNYAHVAYACEQVHTEYVNISMHNIIQ